MKLKSSILGLALAGATALCSSAPADAQQRPIEPYYFAPKIVYSHTMMDSMNTTGQATGEISQHGSLGRYNGGDKTDNSLGGGVAIGYDFGAYSEYPIRMELEYLYRGNVNGNYKVQQTANKNIDNGASADGLNQSWNGYDIKSTIQTVMLNAYLDFPTETPFTPYVGAGLGGAYVDSKISGVSYGNISGDTGWYTSEPSTDGDKLHGYRYNFRPKGQQNSWNFAWQVTAGTSYQFTDNVAFDVSYRYSDFGNADLGSNRLHVYGDRADGNYKPGTPPDEGNNVRSEIGTMIHKTKVDLSAHEVLFGLRVTAF